MTTQTYSDSEVIEGLQLAYEDWRGPFSFESVHGSLDELDGLTREQFDRFVAELNVTRCGLCGIDCGSSMCDEDLDKIESDHDAAAADERYSAGKGE